MSQDKTLHRDVVSHEHRTAPSWVDVVGALCMGIVTALLLALVLLMLLILLMP